MNIIITRESDDASQAFETNVMCIWVYVYSNKRGDETRIDFHLQINNSATLGKGMFSN